MAATASPDWETVYERRDEIALRDIAGENLLVPVAGDLARLHAVWVLNPVAAFVWERLDGTRTLLEIRDLVLQEFDVGAERAEADLLAFVRELESADLVSS